MSEDLPVKRLKPRPYSIRYATNMLSQHDEVTVCIPCWAWTEALFRARKELPHVVEDGQEPNLKMLAATLLALDELLSEQC